MVQSCLKKAETTIHFVVRKSAGNIPVVELYAARINALWARCLRRQRRNCQSDRSDFAKWNDDARFITGQWTQLFETYQIILGGVWNFVSTQLISNVKGSKFRIQRVFLLRHVAWTRALFFKMQPRVTNASHLCRSQVHMNSRVVENLSFLWILWLTEFLKECKIFKRGYSKIFRNKADIFKQFAARFYLNSSFKYYTRNTGLTTFQGSGDLKLIFCQKITGKLQINVE